VPGYEIYTVDIGNDRQSGVVPSQSPEAVVLVAGRTVKCAYPSQIKSLQRSNVSLMPDGFDEVLTRTELTDLLAFMHAERTGPQSAAR
jgi:hypothetical protein